MNIINKIFMNNISYEITSEINKINIDGIIYPIKSGITNLKYIFNNDIGLIDDAKPVKRTSGSGSVTVDQNGILIGGATSFEGYDSLCWSSSFDLSDYQYVSIVAYTGAGTNRLYCQSTAKGLIGSGYMKNGAVGLYSFDIGNVTDGKNLVAFGSGQNTADSIKITFIAASNFPLYL